MNALKSFTLLATVCGGMLVATSEQAAAQYPVVTAYGPATPAVGYVPVRRGLFGLRTAYQPVVSYPAVVPVTVAPAIPVIRARLVTVARPVIVASPVIVSQPIVMAQPIVASRPVTVAAPVIVSRPIMVARPVTPYYAPAPRSFLPAPTTVYLPAYR